MDTPVTARVSEVLVAVGKATHELEGRCIALQDVMGAPTSTLSSSIEVVQHLDYVTQVLAGLSHFLLRMAAVCPESWQVDSHDCARDVTLESLAAALRLQSAPPASAIGTLELFE